jgi:ABC-type multidrug transport system fused ATPase/permease subunit
MTRLYLAASWPLQSAQRDGRIQDLLTTYANWCAGAVRSLALATTAAFNLAALLVAALLVNPVASIAAALAALAIGLVLRPLRAGSRRRSGRRAAADQDFATALTELTSNLQDVRVFGVEQEVGDRLDALAARSAHLHERWLAVSGLLPVLYQGTAYVVIVAALGLTYAVSASGLASLGAVVLIMVRSLNYAQLVQAGVQLVHETAPYVETLEAEEARYRAAALPRRGARVDRITEITFDNVSFEYERDIPVLRDVSFVARRGDAVGIVGPTGAGKSTLIQLVLRLRDPVSGTIRADGVDVRGLALDDWYHRITFVPQSPHLFAGTIAENIAFFRDTPFEEIADAARRAHLHGEIMAWPLGYDTPVGERGDQLSGGQQQRLCIARALVGEPDVVVLDEPTSALDVKSERLLTETIADLAQRALVFVVAHRLSTLAVCDRIMVFHDGRLQAFDDPVRLEQTNGFYREALELAGLRHG